MISSTASLKTFLGNGSNTNFPFSFVGVMASDLQVIYVDPTGVSTIIDPSLYTVALNPVPPGGLWGIGGSITYPNSGPAIPNNSTLTILRIVPHVQGISIANQGAFYPQAVEQALDLLELQLQQTNARTFFSINVPETDFTPPVTLPSASQRANGYLVFDNHGQPTVSNVAPSPGNVTTAVTRIINTTGVATFNILPSDSFGGVSIYQSGDSTVTLQLPSGFGPFPVFDASNISQTQPITILPPAGKSILGLAKYVLQSNGGSVTFYNDSVQILIG